MTWRRLQLRYPGVCRTCEEALPAGRAAWWNSTSSHIACLDCHDRSDDAGEAAQNRAGGSAQAEYERRRAAREQRIRSQHPIIGGAILALTSEPHHQKAWARGAAGERAVARRLERLEKHGVVSLHDRRVPGSRANIDHLVVGPAGVFVIDAKRWSGKVERRGWLSRDDGGQLYVNGRDRSKTVHAIPRQVDVARQALARTPHHSIAVYGVMAISDATFPWWRRRPYDFQGVRVCDLDMLQGLVRSDGPLDPNTIDAVVSLLTDALPPAT